MDDKIDIERIGKLFIDIPPEMVGFMHLSPI